MTKTGDLFVTALYIGPDEILIAIFDEINYHGLMKGGN